MKKLIFTLSMLFVLFAATAQQNITEDSVQCLADSTNATDDQAQELVQNTQEWVQKNQYRYDYDLSHLLNNFVMPVIAMVLVFLTLLTSLFLLLYFPYKKQRAKYQLLENAIDRGREIPTDLLQDKSVKKSSLESIFIIIGFGLGVLITSLLIRVAILFGVSAIILFAGIGKLAAYLIEKKKENRTTENE